MVLLVALRQPYIWREAILPKDAVEGPRAKLVQTIHEAVLLRSMEAEDRAEEE